MKNVIRTLLITTAIVGFTSAANANMHEANHSTTTTTTQQTQIIPLKMDQETKEMHVRALQQALNNRGYNAGPVDGKLGNTTTAALEEFQRDAGLPVTGVATQTEFNALGLPNQLVMGTERTYTQERVVSKVDLATQGSENANVYDDPNADRNGGPIFTQRYQRVSERNYAPRMDGAGSYYDAQRVTNNDMYRYTNR